ncbi:MAG: outer membrane protein assembly factor BamD [Bacteroidetes bacterium]|nr:outer membrane protein assembly factor BamD [Bacteroidota bacterium]
MKTHVYFFSLLLSVFFLSACSSTKEVETLPVDVQYSKAEALYNNDDYLEAIEAFKLIIIQYPGSEFADKAQYYLAECRFKRGEFILAASEYDNLVRLMPSSPFAPLARYKKALSFYELSPRAQLDQKYTKLAIDEFQNFIEFYPKDTLVQDAETKLSELSDKIAKKVFENGLLYYRLEYYRAAIKYFDDLIEQYHDSQYTDDGYFWKAKCQYERRDYTAALNTLSIVEEKYPQTDLKEKITKLRADIQYDMAHPNPTFFEKLRSWL